MLGLETALLHTSTHTSTHTHTHTHHALLSLICTFMRTKLVLGWSIYVNYIAPSIHEHREPQRRNELMPHLTHTTSLRKGTKYVHISWALQQICGEYAGQLKSEHCSSSRLDTRGRVRVNYICVRQGPKCRYQIPGSASLLEQSKPWTRENHSFQKWPQTGAELVHHRATICTSSTAFVYSCCIWSPCDNPVFCVCHGVRDPLYVHPLILW